MIWFLIAIILTGILLSVSLYKYENQQFSKLTGYSYFQVLINKRVRSTYNLVRKLEKVKGEHKILWHLKLPNSNKVIDLVFVHPSGVYVLNFQKETGWIFGREQDDEWVKAHHKERVGKFPNPIVDNNDALSFVNRVVPNLDSKVVFSLITFSDKSTFHKIEINSVNVDVIKTNDLTKYWNDKNQQILSSNDITKVFNALTEFVEITEVPKKSGVKHLPVN
ncbi:nuclease-related domain-containing protein [Ureibacillus sp. NPDC094379]